MGFKIGAHAMVFDVDTRYTDRNVTRLRISISQFNTKTNSYEYDWNGYVSVLGADPAQRAARLKEKDIITLKEIDETLSFKDGKEYVNRKVYDFDVGKKTYNRNAIVWTDYQPRRQQNDTAVPAHTEKATVKAEEKAVAESEDALSDNLPF